MLRTVGMLRKTYSARKREKEKPESSPYAQCVQASPGKSMMSESREAVNRRTGSVCGTPSEAPVLPTAVLTLRGRSVICPKIGQITLRPLSVRTAVGDARTSAVGSAGASASGAGPRESTGHANQSERIKASEPKARNAQSSSSAFRASRRFPREGAGWRTRGLLHGERRRKRFCPAMQLCWRARPLRSRRRARS